MFAHRSTHKRKRSSARRDAAHSTPVAGRAIVTSGSITKTDHKGKAKAPDYEEVDRVKDIAVSHPFNHRLTILAPLHEDESLDDFIKIAKLPATSLGKATFARVSLSLFLDPVFHTAYVKRGSLIALARGRLDVDDVVCLDGQGKLHLHLTRETYQTLGLVGQQFKHSNASSGRTGDRQSGRPERYLVTIDLRAPSFVPGKAGYERTRNCLRLWDEKRSSGSAVPASWDVLFSWGAPGSDAADTIDIPAAFVKSGSVRSVEATRRDRELEDVWLPEDSIDVFGARSDTLYNGKAHAASTSSEIWQERAETLTEWASLSTLSSESVRTYWRPDQTNGYEVTSPRRAGRLAIIEYEGFFHSNFAQQVLHSTTRLAQVTSNPGLSARPLVMMRSTGFADSPLAWLTGTSAESPSTSQPASLLSQSAPADVSMDEDTGSPEGDPHSHLYDDTSDDDTEIATGPTARRKRNKARQKRGYTNADQLGHAIASHAPSPASASGWLAFLSSTKQDLLWLAIENVGGTMRS